MAKWLCCMFAVLQAVASGAESIREKLEAVTFGDGWKVIEPIAQYDPDNAYDYINGEAEFFMPYGFQKLYAIRLGTAPDAPVTLTVDLFALGSPLDAWGVYRAIRRRDAVPMQVGLEGARTDMIALFCQGPHFARVLISGANKAEEGLFEAAAKAVSASLPQGETPRELALLDVEGVDKDSARYVAKSVLAYPFFPRGLVADAAWKEGDREIRGRVLALTARDDAEAESIFEEYAKWLTDENGGKAVRKSASEMAAEDALYQGVLLRREGQVVFGVIQNGPPDDGAPMLERIVRRYRQASAPAPAQENTP